MRIVVGGIHTECSTYNPVLIQEHDFRILRDKDLLDAPYFEFLRDYQAEFIPTIHARAVPGGPVEPSVYQALKAEFLAAVEKALPVDGIYLAMHGAMYVDDIEDAEGDWIGAVRTLVGNACPISVSYDLHGNLTQRIIDSIDIFSSYRTAPHIDVEQTMRRSVRMLIASLAEGVSPFVVWAPIPVVLPGERTSTATEPARRLYAMLPAADRLPGVWDASLMVGYVWADEPRATAAAVLTGTDRDMLTMQAELLAQAYWDARSEFGFGDWTGSIKACVERAISSPHRPFIIADSGDNPTGGGVGDRPDLLRELLRQGAANTIVAGITDPAATQRACDLGLGAEFRALVGSALDPAGGPALLLEGRVGSVVQSQDPMERQAVVRASGIDVVLAAKRRPYHNKADLVALGLRPEEARIIVVKSGYLSPEMSALAADNAMALSPGVVDQDIARLLRLRKACPTYPFDPPFAWQPSARVSARLRPLS